MKTTRLLGLTLGTALFLSVSNLTAQVVINEFQYDDTGTDNQEFVELFNSGLTPVDISGWSVGGRDASGLNISAAIPGAVGSGTTMLAVGGYYVLANTGVLNVNQVVAGGFLENDGEQLELWNGAFGTSTLVDGVVYEGNKGTASYGALSPAMATQVTSPFWGNHQGTDLGVSPALRPTVSVGRYVDGLDSNINGRDFGMRPGTPGTANNAGIVTSFVAPNVDALADGAAVSGLTGSFVGARAFTPGVVTAGLNPNAIANTPNGSKPTIAWDSSGGGNGVTSDKVFNGAVSYDIVAYFDTRHMTVNSNATDVKFAGSEQTIFGLGSGDALANLSDLSGRVGLTTNISANGASGISWYYEKVGESALGLNDVSQKLYLVDAHAGGNSSVGSAIDWTILATVDLANTPAGWFRLSISIDAAGNGTARFDNQVFLFTTAAGMAGEFFVDYRENAQLGANGVPDFLRPASFAPVPEPSTFALAGLGGLALLAFRRRK